MQGVALCGFIRTFAVVSTPNDMKLLTLTTLAFFPTLVAAQTIDIDASDIIGNIPSLIYGAGTEDVNHEIYGGLYDQRIFGEGFEEPTESYIEGFIPYDSRWTVSGDMFQVVTVSHGKLVYKEKDLSEGTVEVDVRLDSSRPIAGIIFDVQEAGDGADNFRGYEVSLDADGKTFVFGKHDHNWQPVVNKPADFNTAEWNSLRIELVGTKAVVYLNDKEVYTYEDKSSTPLMHGKVGLRSFDGSASFRHLKVNGEAIVPRQTSMGVSKMWEAVGDGIFIHDGSAALTGEYSQKLSGAGGVAIANKGLNKWGIAVDRQPMQGCVYLKGDCGKAFVALQNADGSKEYARQTLTGITGEWKRFPFSMTPSEADSLARFVVGLASDGNLWVDQALLHTDSYPFREDITEAFRQENLTFLRYGGTMVNAPGYMTKNMTGNRELREPYTGHWYRHATNGFAIPEFVEFARLIGTEPTFAINIEDNPSDVLALLKEIEPYHLNYIEIGNEENLTSDALADYEHYVARFNVLYDAIHAVYPDLKFISAAWWRADKTDVMEYVFRQLDGKCALWDYHPWTETFAQAQGAEKEIRNMQAMFSAWNPNTDMRCAILEENGNTHDMARGLAHAEMLNVVRRANGFVELDSPANALQPYMQNDNGWDQGQIFFSPSRTWCQPPYYVQRIAAKTHQPLLVKSTLEDGQVDATVMRNQAGDTLVVHIVNPAADKRNIKMALSNFGKVKEIKSYSVSATTLNDRNTPMQPEKITDKESSLAASAASLPVEGYCYTAFVIITDKPASVGHRTATANIRKGKS